MSSYTLALPSAFRQWMLQVSVVISHVCSILRLYTLYVARSIKVHQHGPYTALSAAEPYNQLSNGELAHGRTCGCCVHRNICIVALSMSASTGSIMHGCRLLQAPLYLPTLKPTSTKMLKRL